ncbi:aromatic acid exporter family protein [Fusibacter paucivorans]|uniref:Aromatic acid exporter family protein n=1 Tax=Fusibacter paucivorans TaxID=76009 RepID=A0ABS5PPW7_9FIRM|nr:aromatic acid exporter family protein [Fusibacter paucivorans]MBS7527214.1 aromatic acid exporter family protein [Fusibacter paucivorans]
MVIRTLKNVVAAVGAAWIAQMLHLNFATAASVIAMLSLLDTQKQTFSVAWKRFYTAIIGLVISLAAFNLFGYNIISLGIFLLVFVPVATRLKAKEGIVVNTVIATHYLSYGVMTMPNVLNEMMLLGIGIGVGILLNLHMPSLEPDLIEAQQDIEQSMKQFFLNMSEKLIQMDRNAGSDFESFKALERRIKKAKKKASKAQENFIFSKHQDYVAYFQMRLDQFYWMLYMQKHFERIFVTQREAKAMGEFIHKAAHQFTPTNDASFLLIELAALREDFMKKELPKDLLIFENYASLFQLMNDLEIFLELKVKYLEDDLMPV